MPRRPANWLDGEISLRMEKLEADFLREHVARVRPKDRAEPSLIARLARLEMVPPSDMFDDAVLAVAGDDRPALVRAEQAACLSGRSEEHTSELQSLMRISYAVLYLKKK